MSSYGRLALTACLALAPITVAFTPLPAGPSPVLWCCTTRDRLAAPRPVPPVAPARTPLMRQRGSATRRRDRRRGEVRRLFGGEVRQLLGGEVRQLLGGEVRQLFGGEVRQLLGGKQTTHFLIEGMRCAACMQTIEAALQALPGVLTARASFSGGRATVSWTPAATDLKTLTRTLEALGFQARPYDPSRSASPLRAVHDAWLLRLGVAGGGALATMFLAEPLYYASAPSGADAFYGQLLRVLGAAVGTLTGAYAGAPFLRGAWDGLRQRRLGMDALVSLGALATWAAGVYGMLTRGPVYFDALLMLLFCLIAGRYAEAAMRRRAYDAMEHLLGHRPATCRVWQGGRLVTLAVAELVVGLEVELAPGEQVPADGVILRGSTHVDEALLTGEARPLPKRPGDTLAGGSVNLEGAVRLKLLRVGADAAYGRLERLVRAAAGTGSQLQSLADRAGHVGTLVIAALAALTAVGWLWLDPHRALPAAVAVLVVTCPCALGLATPAARALVLARALAFGALVKRADALERLADARHVVFDKTGTLTRGEPVVTDVLGSPRALDLACRLEVGSQHPLARAIVAQAHALGRPSGAPPADFEAVAGRGVRGTLDGQEVRVGTREWLAEAGLTVPPAWEAQALSRAAEGASVAWVAQAREVVGGLVLSDEVRPEAVALLARLRALGLTITLLSGDSAPAVAAIAKQLDITHAIAGASPAHKQAVLAELQATGHGVIMVGDGLNDAPALVAADVGIAVTRGWADLTVLSADIVLLGGHPGALPGLITLARRMVRVMKDGFGLSALYNALAIPLAVSGCVSPLLAAILMPISSLVVLASALRLRTPRPGER